MIEYRPDSNGGHRRVHREYVTVVAQFDPEGRLQPVTVCWKDGRSFTIDEILEQGEFSVPMRGRQQAKYRVRFGGHETELYLERREAVPALGEPESLRWWVYAYDQTLPGSKDDKPASKPASMFER